MGGGNSRALIGCGGAAVALLLVMGPFAGFKGTLWGAVALALLLATVSFLTYRGRRGIMLAVLSLLLLIGWVEYNPFNLWFSTRDFGNRQFDAQVWKASGPDTGSNIDTPRSAMLYSLLKTHRQLKGMTYDEVLALLGPPDYVDE